MSVTLTANYKEVLATDTVEKIDELLEDNYALDDILEFIDTYNERMFVDNYEEYCRCGEVIGYDAVDAYAEENGIDYIEDCDSRYVGEYRSEAEFTEEYYDERHDIPSDLVIDWQATWDSMLRYDFTFCNGYVFSDN
jgi:hypothetical protein